MSEPEPRVVAIAATVSAALERWADDEPQLAEYETVRLARLRVGADAAAFRAAHLVVRCAAARLLGVASGDLRLAQHCETCGGDDHGRPSLPDHPGIELSLSHTRGAVAGMAATSRCGIDVEARADRPSASERMWQRCLHPNELAGLAASPERDAVRLRYWVRKEAFVKAGVTTLATMATLDLSALGATSGRRLVSVGEREWWVTDLDVPGVTGAIVSAPAHIELEVLN